MAKEIVVLPGGWVFIGEVTPSVTGGIRVDDASCIRYWGTTAGLGEIAVNGPTPKTILDFTGALVIDNTQGVFRILCKK